MCVWPWASVGERRQTEGEAVNVVCASGVAWFTLQPPVKHGAAP